MDIHRCRFVHYQPSTINVLAFSHVQSSRERKAANIRLAIGRANGDIEIWNPLNGAWLQETILHGGKDRSVDGLVWTQDPDEPDADQKLIVGRLRLFSIGYTTTVTEWDLEKSQPLRQSSGNHGEIWCLAAQPSVSPGSNGALTFGQWQGQNLVTGCTDGAVVLYSTENQDLKLQRVLVRPSARKAKVISVIFQDRNFVVAGCTDSTIRIYDIRNGNLVRSMSLGTGPAGGPKEIIVWAVRCLPNGNIISGDSMGELRIWDGKTYTLVQRVKSHRQDILSLATSVDGSIIFSGGMDRRTVLYKQKGGQKSRWGEVSHRRFHTHDVKTMATFESKRMSIVVSGGPDASPVVVPLQEFGMENQRMLPCLPQAPIVQSAPKKRLLISWWDREVHIWKMLKTSKHRYNASESESETEGKKRSRRLLAKVVVKGEASITSAAITADGCLLAVSTSAEIKIFHLKIRPSQEESLTVSRLEVPVRLAADGARLVQFSPDGKWLCVVRRDSQVVTARIHGFDSRSAKLLSTLLKLGRLARKLEKHISLGGLGAYDRTITRVAFSSDSRILAASDLDGYVDTWLLEGVEDLSQDADDETVINDTSQFSSFGGSDSDDDIGKMPVIVLGQHWIRNPLASSLPKLPSTAVVLAFRPAGHMEEEFQSNTIVLPHPTRRNPHPHSHDLPKGEDRLVILTAGGGFFEFSVLKGALSDWSRRNPTTKFPEEFKGLRDQAMGCLWDLQNSKERLWLYGTNWMWMFDLAKDLPSDTPILGSLMNGNVNGNENDTQHPRPKKKRKVDDRHNFKPEDLRNGTSGAGSRIPDRELGIGMSRKHQRMVYEKGDYIEQSTIDQRRRQAEMDMDDSDEEMGGDDNLVLEQVKRGEEVAVVNGNGRNKSAEANGGEADKALHWWHTYKYRPIMGVVPIEGETGLEVVLVERPTFEMELPPRYYGDQEWEKPGL